MSKNDPYGPVIKILKRLTRDSANATNTVLALFAGARKVSTTRLEFDDEIQKTIDQVGAMVGKWQALQSYLLYMESAASEINEQELIKVVEQAADATMLTEQMERQWNLAQNDCALRIYQLDPELVPYAVKEVSTYEGGPERLSRWRAAIDEVLTK